MTSTVAPNRLPSAIAVLLLAGALLLGAAAPAAAGGITEPTITTLSLPDGQDRAAYDEQIEFDGFPAGGTKLLTLTSGSLPPGLFTAPVTHRLTGLPVETGTFTFTLRITRLGSGETAVREFTVVISPHQLGPANVGDVYAASVKLVAVQPSYTLDSGVLPPGLTLDVSGAITGTPDYEVSYVAQQEFVFTVQAVFGPITTYTDFSILLMLDPPSVLTNSLPDGAINEPYDQLVDMAGFGPVLSATGLPNGLAIIDSRIVGAPTQAGTFNITLFATNGAGAGQQLVTLEIAGPALAATGGEPAGLAAGEIMSPRTGPLRVTTLRFSLELGPCVR